MGSGSGVGVLFTALLAGALACGSPYDAAPVPERGGTDAGSERASTPVDGGAPADDRPECAAQRVVAIVAGEGGFAWFTLLWPIPEVIERFESTFAFDDPARAVQVSAELSHPLYVRKTTDDRPLWEGTGLAPHPSVLLGPSNQTHTSNPTHLRTTTGADILVAGAAAQVPLGARLPLLGIGDVAFGQAVGAPPPVVVARTADAIATVPLLNLPAAEQAVFAADEAKVASWVGKVSTPAVKSLAESLVFVSVGMRLGVLGTVAISALTDDPHAAFASVEPTAGENADAIARVLDSFYAELATTEEPACVRQGKPISLADNVVMLVYGDTPKNSFARDSWSDGSRENTNWIYVRSNGHLKTGWFGRISRVEPVVYADPTTGAPSPTATKAEALAAAQAAVLHTIVRGDTAKVTSVTSAPYAGYVEASAP